MSLKCTLRCYLVIVLLLGMVAPAEANPNDERRYAVIIGNNVGSAEDGDLLYAHKDAMRFASVMRKFGNLQAENTMLLLDDSASEIRRALLKMNERIRESNAGGSSTLLVYYSGHADAAGLHPGPTTLPYSELRSMLRGSAATLRVLILDGCRSGELTSVKGGRQTKEFEIAVEASSRAEGVVMISSSAAGEDSHESSRLRGSFFSHHFLNALVGAGDDDRDSSVSLNEAYRYAYRNTLRASGRTSRLQHPTYSYDLKGRSDFTMTQLLSGKKSARLRLGKSGTYLIYRGKEGGELVAEVNVVARSTVLSLPPETYFVQRRASDHFVEYQVRLGNGETVELDLKQSRKVAYARLVRKGAREKTSAGLVYVLAGARGEIIEVLGGTPGVVLGYQLDLPVFSVSARARVNASAEQTLSSALSVRHIDWGLSLVAQHYFDLDAFSIGVGLLGEVLLHQQSFRGTARAEGRQSVGYAIGALATVEREIGARMVLKLEGGPITYRFLEAETKVGSEVGSSISTSLSPWVALGLGLRF